MHHAGNSSGVVDGSAAILLASPNYARAHGLKPRARVVAMANMGDLPTLMLNAPVPAARKVLAKAGLTLDDIDLFEINEAFAVVTEKFIRDLEARPRQGQCQWRVDCPRSSDRRDRLDPDRDHSRRTGAAGPQTWPGNHVRRRRNGAGDHYRTRLRREGDATARFWPRPGPVASLACGVRRAPALACVVARPLTPAQPISGRLRLRSASAAFRACG